MTAPSSARTSNRLSPRPVGRGSAVRRNRPPSVSPMTMCTSCASLRATASSNPSTALVGRSLDRTNDRLLRLFHAGYIDRPRAQLDYYPTAGSSPIAYALADRGARLLIQRDGVEFANVEWSRKNRKAGRPFIEHQLEIVDFSVALQVATGARRDVQFIHPSDIIAAFPEQTRAARNPLSLRVKLSHQGAVHEIGLVPDLVFGLQFADGSRHSFMVEIDRGTMPIGRSDFLQTSFERKMRAYLTAHAGKQHEKHFGWKTFRVLTVTTDQHPYAVDDGRAAQAAHSAQPRRSPLLFHDARPAARLRSPRAYVAGRQRPQCSTELGWRGAQAQRQLPKGEAATSTISTMGAVHPQSGVGCRGGRYR